MKNNERVNEIRNQMTSFSEKGYQRKELLREYFRLQEEILRIVLGGKYIENGNQRIWDAGNYLKMLNEQSGNPADEELNQFLSDSYNISNIIKGIVSGDKGEDKAKKSLDTLKCKHKILRNVELRNNGHKTEIDFIVFTENAVFMVEVKNTKRNIHIDKNGNYYRVGHNTNYDCNIGEKMNDKEYLLREVLTSAGVKDVNIVSLLVFTNSLINVNNEYEFINVCFLSSLPHIIDSYTSGVKYSYWEISRMFEVVDSSRNKNEYAPEIDVERMKENLAVLLVKLEESANCTAEKTISNKSDRVVTSVVVKPKRIKLFPKLAGLISAALGIGVCK